MSTVYDYIGIGFGPSNIALAIALEENGWQGNILYLEKQVESLWQPDMLLDGSDIQHNPIRDFITLRNPQSKYTFINYLHQERRLIDYLNLGLDYPFRKEYSRYVTWAARQFSNVKYECKIDDIVLVKHPQENSHCYKVITSHGEHFLTRGLIIGHGRSAYIPPVFNEHLGDRIFHFTEYLEKTNRLFAKENLDSVCVVGGSQSAIEIVLDLRSKYRDVKIINVMRSYGYRLRDTSSFTRTIFMPEFIDYFYDLPHQAKQNLRRELHHTNYSVADADAIKKLNGILYEDKLDERERITIINNSQVERVVLSDGKYVVELLERHAKKQHILKCDAIIIATGFRDFGNKEKEESLPKTLRGLSDTFVFDEHGEALVNKDYSMVYKNYQAGLNPCFLNGLCEHSHGFGDAGTFSTLAFRAQTIEESIKNHTSYRTIRQNV